jgi:hypothetical protein
MMKALFEDLAVGVENGITAIAEALHGSFLWSWWILLRPR